MTEIHTNVGNTRKKIQCVIRPDIRDEPGIWPAVFRLSILRKQALKCTNVFKYNPSEVNLRYPAQ